MTLNPFRHFGKRLNVVIVAYGKLIESGGAGFVVNSCNFGYNQSRASLCTFFIVVHHSFGGRSVELSETEHHRGHHDSVFDFAISDFHRA